jgi:hypothetical protein
MRRIVTVWALLIAAATVTLFALLWLHRESCYGNTIYSERFSTDVFTRITVGTARTSVINSLGIPLNSSTNQSYPVWALTDEAARRRYGSVSNVQMEFLMFSQPKNNAHDFHWVQVCIGPDSTVIGTSSYITD